METLNAFPPRTADVENNPPVAASAERELNNEENASSSPPRLIPRDLPYYQSRNKVQVEHNFGLSLIWKLVRYDLFHVLLRLHLYESLFILLTVWTIFILFFAGVYVATDRQDPLVACGLGPAGSPISFYGAFAFSLETCTSIASCSVLLAYCYRSPLFLIDTIRYNCGLRTS
jgi:hypothetical protein